jgi:hypothetical protein
MDGVDSSKPPDNDFDMDTINAFWENGASLVDRTILLKQWEPDCSYLSTVQSRELPPRSSTSGGDFKEGMLFVIEVNARYLLEDKCRPIAGRLSTQRTKFLSRPDVQKSQSHQRVLLVHPGYSMNGLPPCTPSEDSKKELLGPSVLGERTLRYRYCNSLVTSYYGAIIVLRSRSYIV